jgi:hypothetical protein
LNKNITDDYLSEGPPAAPIEKPATPVAASSSDEDDTTVANTKTEEAKTSSESEEESTEDVVAPPSKPSTETPLNEITRPTLPIPPATSRIPPKLVSSESSESDESDSDSDSDSDEEEEEPKPAPVARFNNTRTTPATPQTNTRVIPLRTATNTNDITSQPPETSSMQKNVSHKHNLFFFLFRFGSILRFRRLEKILENQQ